MNGFDLRIPPVKFSALREHLETFDIIESGEFEGARVFRQFRMGVGTADFYPVAYRGEDAEVFPPTIMALLGHFGISADEWYAANQGIRKAAE